MAKQVTPPANQYPNTQFVDVINRSILQSNSMAELYENLRKGFDTGSVRTLFSFTPFVQMMYWTRITRDYIYIEKVDSENDYAIHIFCIIRQKVGKDYRYIMFMGDGEAIRCHALESLITTPDPVIAQHRDAPMVVRRKLIEKFPRPGGKAKPTPFIPAPLFPSNMSCISDDQFDQLVSFGIKEYSLCTK